MPELPDVEGFRRVAESAAGQRIAHLRVHDESVLHGHTVDTFRQTLTGRRLGSPSRHGKWLLLPTEPATSQATDTDGFPMLILHFGMTGMLLCLPLDEPWQRHDRVAVRCDEGELRFRDMRKLKGIHLAREASERDAVLADLGPDAATVPRAGFRERVGRTRRQLKPALMDQTRVAGLGNITVDEILWQARLPPTSTTADLDDAGWGTLHRTMRSVLRQSSRVGHVPERRSWLTGHRDESQARCPRCRTRLRSGRVGGRTTLWCPYCQPARR